MINAEDINKVIYELLRFRRSESSKTSHFKKLKHTKDLCPLIEKKITKIIESFNKYKRIVYDIQGFHDKGTDILFRESDDENNSYICFQIKNEDDFLRSDVLKELKAQHSDSTNNFSPCIAYYILICADINISRDIKDSKGNGIKENIKLNKQANQNIESVRKIEAAFSTYKNTFIIDSSYMETFLNLTLTQIDAVTKSKFGDEDVVFKKAIDITSVLTPSESSIIYFMIWKFTQKNTIHLLHLNP